ncbi:FBD-associated F-box protein [Camellia lanceoleosa]|uniref:FBD-associated F-box protein n=1 Tax=Camellia lanceoleosa TaxID=1840588 RepID=A0ACC0HHG6_9ERIC|nr:FBD-associated F-box protein [Camellia lanceoleosa]
MMDQSSKLSDSKQKDRISNLPDEILSHILCFMPTKYAARTSLLSTGWKSIWTSVHIIDLDSLGERRHNERSSGFMDFVDRLLLLRNSLNLNKFRLQCRNGYYNPDHLNSWICTVIKLNVKELVLNFKIDQVVVELPQSLFTSVNLVVLKLAGDVCFRFPMPVFWPSLKVLHLHSLMFLDDDSFQSILSGCPVLEELDIERTNLWDNIKTLCICSSTLKKLRMYNNFCGTSLQQSVVIKAPVLEIFQLTDMYSVFDVDKLPSLVKAKFSIYFDNYRSEDYYNGVVGMLGKISNVQHLELSNVIPKVVVEAFDYNTLSFHNLTHLHLQISDIHWSILLDLLGHMPNLKVLVLNQFKDWKVGKLCLRSGEPESVPKCLSLCLEAIEFSGFAGSKGEMKLVNEARKVKSVPDVSDPALLPKDKSQAKYKAVTLPYNNQEAELGEIEESPTNTRTMMGFQQIGYIDVRLDNVDEPYINNNNPSEKDQSEQYHQANPSFSLTADAANITLFDSYQTDTRPYHHFERDNETRLNFNSQEDTQIPIPSPPRPAGPQKPNPSFSLTADAANIALFDSYQTDTRPYHHFERFDIEGDNETQLNFNSQEDTQIPIPSPPRPAGPQKQNYYPPRDAKSGPLAADEILDQHPEDQVNQQSNKQKEAIQIHDAMSTMEIGNPMELPPVALICGLSTTGNREIHYPAPLLEQLWRISTIPTRDLPSGRKSPPQPPDPPQPPEPSSSSPPDRAHYTDPLGFPSEDFHSGLGSQSRGKLWANLETHEIPTEVFIPGLSNNLGNNSVRVNEANVMVPPGNSVLASRDVIRVEQEVPYGDILISRGLNM